MPYLQNLVLERARSLGPAGAAEFFGVRETQVDGWLQGKPIPLAAAERVLPEAIETAVHSEQLQKAEWAGKKVAILLPWYKSTNPVTAFCVAGLIDRAKMSVILNFNDAMISHSRNFLATQFLTTEIEWCFSLDDDMVVPWGNAGWYNKMTGFNFEEKWAGQNVLTRLLSHEKTVIGALYFGRHPEGKPLYAEGWASQAEANKARKAPFDAISATRWVATGALLVHRKVFLDIEAKYPGLSRCSNGRPGKWYSPSEHDLVGAATKALAVLNDDNATESARVRQASSIIAQASELSARNSIVGMGEDVSFCMRAAAAGHPAYVDFGCVAGHVGNAVYGPRNTRQ